MNVRKTPISVATAILGIGVLAAVQAAAGSPPTQGGLETPTPDSSLVVGDEQDAAVADIRAMDEGRGYYAVLTSFKNQTIAIKWKDPVPDDVAALKGTKLHDFLITDVDAVKYDAKEVTRASEQLLASTSKNDQPRIFSATGNDSGDGLVVSVSIETYKKYGEARLHEAYDSTAKQMDDFALNAAFAISVTSQELPTLTDRQDDASPWTAGVMMKTDDFAASGGYVTAGDACSVGFDVINSSGDGRMLSAGHCNDSPPTSWRDGAMDLFASSSDVQHHATDDTLLIDPTGSTRAFVFGGPWNASSSYTPYRIAVAADSSSYNGDVICGSGANSGERCGREVLGTTELVGLLQDQGRNRQAA